jgi:hypothetical protein
MGKPWMLFSDIELGIEPEPLVLKEGALADCGKGEGNGDRPLSLISVLDDSAPGEVVVFQPKKDVILFPGVLGSFSPGLGIVGRLASMCRGGGRLWGGCKAIVSDLLWFTGGGDLSTGMMGSLERRE